MPFQTHGGNIYGFLSEGLKPPRDFSANVNPLGLPRGMIDAVADGLATCDRYPDPMCTGLRRAIAQEEGIVSERIVCGNGAADLIYRLVGWKKPRKALVTAPTFGEYEKALQEFGCSVTQYYLQEEEFQVTKKLMDALTPDLDLVFLCNPNNPTGRTIPAGLLEDIADHCERWGILLVVDECFNFFLDEPERNTLKGRLQDKFRKIECLAILKAFTKAYAMAGFRLGYLLCANERMAESVAKIGQPWSVSTPAQLAGIQACKEKSYIKESRQLIAAERERMRTDLLSLGMKTVSGDANYLFFQAPEDVYGPGELFFWQLLSNGFLLRNCSNYPGLANGYFRIAVKLPAENTTLLRVMKEIKEHKLIQPECDFKGE